MLGLEQSSPGQNPLKARERTSNKLKPDFSPGHIAERRAPFSELETLVDKFHVTVSKAIPLFDYSKKHSVLSKGFPPPFPPSPFPLALNYGKF